MASYAPLLAREGHTQWNPDLIYFNNTEVKPSVGYFVQKLFGQNSGDKYYTSTVELSDSRQSVSKRVTVSVVRDSKSNDLIVKLVNLLPIDVNAQLNLQGINVSSSKARCTVLSGEPNATDARPVTNEISVSNDFGCVLPAYSFTVIRIDGEQPGN
jgi:alpha-L-arabinofuranosidase